MKFKLIQKIDDSNKCSVKEFTSLKDIANETGLSYSVVSKLSSKLVKRDGIIIQKLQGRNPNYYQDNLERIKEYNRIEYECPECHKKMPHHSKYQHKKVHEKKTD